MLNIFNRPDRLDGFDLPSAYGYYSWEHILVIILTCIAVGFFAFIFFGKKHLINKMYIISASLAWAFMIATVIWSAVTGIWYLEWYLPLHICNATLIIYPLAAIFKGRVRRLLNHYIVWAGFLGWFIATLFPLTTLFYFPTFHPVSILVFLFHLVLALQAVYLVSSGNYRSYNILAVMPPIWILAFLSTLANYYLGTNFLFLNLAMADVPITIFQEWFGTWAVWVILILLTIIGLVLQLLSIFFNIIKEKTVIALFRHLVGRVDKGANDVATQFIDTFIDYSERIPLARKFKKSAFAKVINDGFLEDVTNFILNSSIDEVTDPKIIREKMKEYKLVRKFMKTVGLISSIYVFRRVKKETIVGEIEEAQQNA